MRRSPRRCAWRRSPPWVSDRGAAGVGEQLEELAVGDGPPARGGQTRPHRPRAGGTSRASTRGVGLTVAQLFLHADIDPALPPWAPATTAASRRCSCGSATPLSPTRAPAVQRVITLSRGPVAQAADDLSGDRRRDVRATSTAACRCCATRCPRPRRGRSASPPGAASVASCGPRDRVDLLHLRMADVGSLAAADVARELGIPTVFTVAPDPHARDPSRLDRVRRRSPARTSGPSTCGSTSGSAPGSCRASRPTRPHRPVPPPGAQRDMRQLVGIDIDGAPRAPHDRRRGRRPRGRRSLGGRGAEAAAGGARPAALAELRSLIEQLAPERRDLPLVVSVGRMHRVKGMATLVEAWAPGELRDRANLLIIGGDLDRPVARRARAARPHRDVVLPTTRARRQVCSSPGTGRTTSRPAGWRPRVSACPASPLARGVYVCASVKEEFGIALLEAMAAG